MWKIFILCMGLLVTACSNTTNSGKWREVQSNTKESRLERAKAICEGEAGNAQLMAGRYWIAGAMAAHSNFKACMAKHGFVQD